MSRVWVGREVSREGWRKRKVVVSTQTEVMQGSTQIPIVVVLILIYSIEENKTFKNVNIPGI